MMAMTIAGITMATLAVLGYPLVRRRAEGDRQQEESHVDDQLVSRKDSLYRDIKELELDWEMGKVAEADYTAMRFAYQSEAALVLEEMVRRRNGGGGGACAQCGKPGTGGRFCPHCGSPVGTVCQSCSEPILAKDAFCSACGAMQAGV